MDLCENHIACMDLCENHTENGVSFHMCSAVEIAWLAQNIRHGSTSV